MRSPPVGFNPRGWEARLEPRDGTGGQARNWMHHIKPAQVRFSEMNYYNVSFNSINITKSSPISCLMREVTVARTRLDREVRNPTLCGDTVRVHSQRAGWGVLQLKTITCTKFRLMLSSFVCHDSRLLPSYGKWQMYLHYSQQLMSAVRRRVSILS